MLADAPRVYQSLRLTGRSPGRLSALEPADWAAEGQDLADSARGPFFAASTTAASLAPSTIRVSTRSAETVPSMIVPRIEQLADRPDLLPIVAGWLYGEWWASVADETVENLAGRLGAHLIRERIPLTLVASLEGGPVGTATLLAHDVGTEEWPELSPWLAALYVAPEFRCRGIGAALVNAAVAKARALGLEALYLFTIGQEGFYARLGWDLVYKRAEEVVMSKPTGIRAQGWTMSGL